jgi:Na+-translocating ferredoxin:NAD+ oxidoreductase subunit G
MREIIKITIALTISCLVAGLVIGTTFIFTAKAKQQNEHLNVQQTMLGLLGYGKSKPAPRALKLHSIHRYILSEAEATRMGYIVPVQRDGAEGFDLVVLDLKGQFLQRHPVALTAESVLSAEDRKKALAAVLGA